jgi:hypothetical protein
VRACWCRDCQYLAAGNASINAIFRTDGFTLTGEVGEYISTADSGNTMRRRFCPECGTPSFSHSSSRPELMVVRVGALDDREVGGPASFHLDRIGAKLGIRGRRPAQLRGPTPVALK